jgi:hypothetical protein
MIETIIDKWKIIERDEKERRKNHKEKQFSAESQTSWKDEKKNRRERNQAL